VTRTYVRMCSNVIKPRQFRGLFGKGVGVSRQRSKIFCPLRGCRDETKLQHCMHVVQRNIYYFVLAWVLRRDKYQGNNPGIVMVAMDVDLEIDMDIDVEPCA
jgi:hypothetical protein